jgi:glycosyltransferase involved in cell wall biosynthesis
MKILMVTPYVPYPPASGGQIRTLNLLKYLSQNNEIYLVSLYKNEGEKKYIQFLTKYCKQIHLCKRPEKPWQIKILFKTIFSTKPFLIIRNFSKEAEETIKKLLNNNNFDVIHSETFYVMPHIPETVVSILLVEQTIEYKVYQHFVDNIFVLLRPFFYLDVLKLSYWERYYWKKATVVATVSDFDSEIIKNEEKIKSVVIPNGAGDEMFEDKIKNKSTQKPILLFLGNFFWLQNQEAAEYLLKKILPKLKNKLQNFTIIIAGQKAHAIKSNSKNVKIINIDPDDAKKVKELYNKSTLFIAPIFGPGGTRLKILASMASGVPVISTNIGIEGLDVHDKKHVMIANNADEFVNSIKKILLSKKLYNTLKNNSYELVKKNYNWKKISKMLEVVYQNIQKRDENWN